VLNNLQDISYESLIRMVHFLGIPCQNFQIDGDVMAITLPQVDVKKQLSRRITFPLKWQSGIALIKVPLN
jgi:hypothetical protein